MFFGEERYCWSGETSFLFFLHPIPEHGVATATCFYQIKFLLILDLSSKNKIFYFMILSFCVPDGQLITWGQNSHGQLGLGHGFTSQSSPQRVKSLEGIPLAQVTAGGFHSFALSLSGAVFAWGKNNSGQLGLNDEKGKVSHLWWP